MMTRMISDIVAGRPLHRVSPETSLRTACLQMEAADLGALVVTEDDRLLGILSERDVLRRCICAGLPVETTTVADVMTPDPVTITAYESLIAAVSKMLDGNFRHLPVMRQGKVTAMLSIRDIPHDYRMMVERHTRQGQPARVIENVLPYLAV